MNTSRVRCEGSGSWPERVLRDVALRPVGRCASCGLFVLVRADGTLRAHWAVVVTSTEVA